MDLLCGPGVRFTSNARLRVNAFGNALYESSTELLSFIFKACIKSVLKTAEERFSKSSNFIFFNLNRIVGFEMYHYLRDLQRLV